MAWPTTAADWVLKIREWIDTDDTTAVPDSALYTCLDMAVDALNADVESLFAEGVVSYTVTGLETWPMPIASLGITDYNKMSNINPVGGKSMAAKAINELIDLTSLNTSPSAEPVAYAISGNQLYVWPIPSTGTVLQIIYYKKIPYLASGSVESNVFTVSHPTAFLYAALVSATPYIAEDERLQTWKDLYDGQVAAINLTAKKARMGSSPLVRDFNVYGPAANSSLAGL